MAIISADTSVARRRRVKGAKRKAVVPVPQPISGSIRVE
jgi:hypothetical protein